MSTDDRDDLVPTDPTDDTQPTPGSTTAGATDGTTDGAANGTTDADRLDTPDQALTTEEEPTMSGTTPPRTSAWTTDTSTLDQPVVDETPAAAAQTTARLQDDTLRIGEPVAVAPSYGTPAATPVGSVPFPRTLDQPRAVRVGTIVWGLVVTAVAVGLLALANGATYDVQLATIVVIAGAGVALLLGSLLGTRRRHG